MIVMNLILFKKEELKWNIKEKLWQSAIYHDQLMIIYKQIPSTSDDNEILKWGYV